MLCIRLWRRDKGKRAGVNDLRFSCSRNRVLLSDFQLVDHHFISQQNNAIDTVEFAISEFIESDEFDDVLNNVDLSSVE